MGKDTIFHKIMRGEIPSEKIFEDDQVFAIRDINPVSSVHILVIPKEDLVSLAFAEEKHKELLGHMLLVCAKIAEEQGIAKDGYRVVMNAGEKAGQSVFQLHMHVLGGRPFLWPPG